LGCLNEALESYQPAIALQSGLAGAQGHLNSLLRKSVT
jgi:hypothetical protein